MSSPSETASAHKQDRLMTGIGQNPAGIRPMPYRKTIPGHRPSCAGVSVH
jgi:hypothetical protein